MCIRTKFSIENYSNKDSRFFVVAAAVTAVAAAAAAVASTPFSSSFVSHFALAQNSSGMQVDGSIRRSHHQPHHHIKCSTKHTSERTNERVYNYGKWCFVWFSFGSRFISIHFLSRRNEKNRRLKSADCEMQSVCVVANCQRAQWLFLFLRCFAVFGCCSSFVVDGCAHSNEMCNNFQCMAKKTMKCGIRLDLGVRLLLRAFATTEIRHTRVFVSAVNEWRENEQSGDTTRPAIQCSQTHNTCVDDDESNQ